MMTISDSKPVKERPIIPAINWYYGNFLMSPDNALRDIDEEKYFKETHKLVDELHLEFAGQKMTHKLDIMKSRGIHAKFYRYQKKTVLSVVLFAKRLALRLIL